MKRYGILEQFDNILIKDQKSLKFYDANSSNFAELKAPSNIATDYTLTLPVDDGISGQALTTDGSGVLTWATYLAASLTAANIFVGNGSNVATAVDTSSVGDISASSSTGLNIKSNVIIDADINSAAAIALSKLAALTVSRALVSDGSGIISVSSVTATELGYVSGVTSSIQTQLNAITAAAFTSFKATWLNATGATKTVTHSLNSTDVIVQLTDIASGETIEIDTVVRTDANTVTLTASQAPSSGGSGWRVLILKV